MILTFARYARIFDFRLDGLSAVTLVTAYFKAGSQSGKQKPVGAETERPRVNQ